MNEREDDDGSRADGPIELSVTVEEGGERSVPCAISWALIDTTGRRLPFECIRFEYGSEWLALRAVFGPFEICRRFVADLLTLRPARIRIERLAGLSLDLARIAHALGFPLALRLPDAASLTTLAGDPAGRRWVGGVLERADCLLAEGTATDEAELRALFPGLPAAMPALPTLGKTQPTAAFGYEAYALGRRDHALLLAAQEGYAAHFDRCRAVVDAGCGTGVFLEILARRGIPATGVERNRVSARFARSLGHAVIEDDALDYLEAHPASCDGLYCSHFIEHLPVDAATRLMRAVAGALKPDGVAVFVFPDPESIRSQLLGFWRDPEHVRFYHPELVSIMAEANGLAVEYDSRHVPGRRVAAFAMEPSPEIVRRAPERHGWKSRALAWLGVASTADLRREQSRSDALEAAVRRLWEVNQTWAWDDNAVLKLRKPKRQ